MGKKETLSNDTPNVTRVCFGITKLGIGGAERVLVDIANELVEQYDTTIFTIYAGGELEKELNQKIKVVSIYNEEKKGKFIPIYILLCGKHIYNKFFKNKYDIEIAFLEGPITRLFSYGRKKGKRKQGNRAIIKIAWVHNDITKVFGDSLKAGVKKYIDKDFYKKYDKIIFVSEHNKKVFESFYGNISDREVIYNYINKDRVLKESMHQKEIVPMEHAPKRNGSFRTFCTFLTVARLVKQKAIDRLIKVHKRLIDEGLEHKMYIIGDGEERENLQELARKLRVTDTFIFLGKKENPYPYIRQADYFTLLSNYEGYGMVIEEAKILNKPIVITDTAAKEAVQDYSRSLVIGNDEEKIYTELKNILLGKYEYLNKTNNHYNYDNRFLLEEIKQILKEVKK